MTRPTATTRIHVEAAISVSDGEDPPLYERSTSGGSRTVLGQEVSLRNFCSSLTPSSGLLTRSPPFSR